MPVFVVEQQRIEEFQEGGLGYYPSDDIKCSEFYRRALPRGLADFGLNEPRSELINSWTLQYAQPKHIAQCVYLAEQFWQDEEVRRYSDQVGEMFRTSNGPRFFVITSGEKLVGFAGLRESWIMPKTFELIGINIAREHQGHGFGRVLTEVRLELIKALGGRYVILSTIRPRFFERFGFEAIDKDGDWIVMRKVL